MREPELRSALLDRLVSRGFDGPTRVVHELAIPLQAARVDVAVIGSRFVGYEIKTAQDSLRRLPLQSEAYGKVFDRMYLVAESKHIKAALEQLPSWWGVLEARTTARGLVQFGERRASRLNPSVDLHSLVALLWRDELLGQLETLGLGRGVAAAPRAVLGARLAAAAPGILSVSELKSRVRMQLTSRVDWRAA